MMGFDVGTMGEHSTRLKSFLFIELAIIALVSIL